MDDNKTLNSNWFDNLLANVNGTQMSLFDDSMMSAGTITTATSNIVPYGGAGGTGTASGNYTWTTNGTGGYNLGTAIGPSINLTDTWQYGDAKLKVQGDAEFDGDIKLKGKSLSESLDKIEQRLGILYPNEKLEAKWEELKKLGDAYRALEKDILEKEKIWETLKK